MWFAYIHQFSLHMNSVRWVLIIFLFYKWRNWSTSKYVFQGCRSSEWESQDSNPESLALKFILLTTVPNCLLLKTSYEAAQLNTHLKPNIGRLQCQERLKAGGEGDNRGWDGWMVSPTQWTWIWESSRSWWWTGKPGKLQFTESERVGYDWVTELNWTDKQSNVLNARKTGSSLMPLFKGCIGYWKHKKCTWCPLMRTKEE